MAILSYNTRIVLAGTALLGLACGCEALCWHPDSAAVSAARHATPMLARPRSLIRSPSCRQLPTIVPKRLWKDDTAIANTEDDLWT